jgi:predicted MPP superfamily phosphohydrolase
MLWPAILLTALCITAQASAGSLLQYPLSKHDLSQRPLHFSQEKFKLLVITDTHLLDDQDSPGNASNVNKASADAVTSYLELEKPDFVVHLGDLVSGERATSSKDVVGAVRQILKPISESVGRPYCTALN